MTPESPDQSEITPAPEVAKEPRATEVAEETVAKQENKFKHFLKKSLRGFLVYLVVFIAGYLVASYIAVKPLKAELVHKNVETQTMEDQIANLQSELDSLSDLQTENSELQAQVDFLNTRVVLMSALTDVHAAQFALALENPANAKLQLANTANSIDILDSLLGDDRDGTLEGMRQRLDLALTGMDADLFAAQSDLEVLANSLISLDNDLRGTN